MPEAFGCSLADPNSSPGRVMGDHFLEDQQMGMHSSKQVDSARQGQSSKSPHEGAATFTLELGHLQQDNDILRRQIAQARCDVEAARAERDEYKQACDHSQLLVAQLKQEHEELVHVSRHQLADQKATSAAREFFLTQQVEDLQADLEERAARTSSDCVVSFAFASAGARRSYQQALDSFIKPLEERFVMRHEFLDSPTPCKFLIWAIAAGGRLPDKLDDFEAYKERAGMSRC